MVCFERVEQSVQREIAAVVSRGCQSRHERQSEWLGEQIELHGCGCKSEALPEGERREKEGSRGE